MAHGHVILNAAPGPEAAHATARVDALVAFACFGPVAVGVHHTLWLAFLVRVAEELWQAAAYTDSVVYSALSVCATFAVVAWLLLLYNWSDSRCEEMT